MAVEPTKTFKCRRCDRGKGAGNKWWIVKTEGARWSFRDFQERDLEAFDYAICSISCLMADAQGHADKLMAAAEPGKSNPPNGGAQ